ncbi:MAG: Endo,4-beta-xylanase precursor, partial [Pedosphaera sp.]|nr:Endo,4-beta-xylanase precursor [Pedosphaera sp.]
GVTKPFMPKLSQLHLVPGRAYNVRLHFAELVYSNSNQRVFNVGINGTQMLTNFDIISETGGQNKALIKRFNTVADANGQISLQYSSIIDQAKSSGIEILTNTIPNATPMLLAISNATVNVGGTLSCTAKGIDPDQPLQSLAYSIDPGAPSGSSINSSGVFTWSPTVAQSPSTNTITVRATDNGSPALAATRTFTVVVVAPPHISQLTTSPGGNLLLVFDSYPGKTYRIQYKTNLTDSTWTTLGSDVTASSSSTSAPDSMDGNLQRFYRIIQLN